MSQQIRPFLMFTGQAEEAMNFYLSLFPGSSVAHLQRHVPGGPGKEGTIAGAMFVIAGQTIMCTDSVVKHDFTFTPAISLFVNCESEDDVRRLTQALSAGGNVFMPPGSYGFSKLFAWVSDRFGVSWQLNLPSA